MPVAGSEFNDPVLLPNGKLLVSGPYRPGVDRDDQLVGDVVIRYLIFKEDAEPSIPTVQGVATWKLARKPDGTLVDWEHETDPGGLVLEDVVRAVGVAIQAVKYDDDPKVPPSVMSYNWCVTRRVTDKQEESLDSALPVGASTRAS